MKVGIIGGTTSRERKAYVCDPSKHKDCPKTTCQKQCFWTKKKEFAKVLDLDGKKVIQVVYGTNSPAVFEEVDENANS